MILYLVPLRNNLNSLLRHTMKNLPNPSTRKTPPGKRFAWKWFLPLVMVTFTILTGLQLRADDSNPTLVGSYGNGAWGVCIAGTRAYLAGGGPSLEIVDISEPANPYELGSYAAASPVWGVTVSGNYAYLAAEATGLIVVNVSDPALPIRVGGYNTSESAYDIFLTNNLAYVADGQAGLVVIDVSNPALPRRVGGLGGMGEVRQVVVSGNYAYLADRFWNGIAEMQAYGGLRIIDISNPANPKLVGEQQTSGQAWYLTVSGNVAYVGADVLEMFDVSDPVNPWRIGSYGTGGAVALDGNHAFVANFQSGLHVLDISDLTSPSRLGGAQCSGYPRGIALAGGYAYVSAQTSDPNASGVGLQIFDRSPGNAKPPVALSIARSGPVLSISWPASITDAVLESTSQLSPAANWSAAPETPVIVGDDKVVTIQIGAGSRFFRLKKT